MSKLKQRLGLKKQGSKALTTADSSPYPSNLYPMAAGGHHPGNPHVQGQGPTPAPTTAHRGQRPSPHDPAYLGSGDQQEGMAGQGSERLLVQGSAGNEEAEEQAMMELAIKAGLHTICVHAATADINSQVAVQCTHRYRASLHHPTTDMLCSAFWGHFCT